MSTHKTTSTAVDTSSIVYLGDSITDGNTYPGLISQALTDAGVVVDYINAGIGGDTAAGMHARLDRDVFAYKPTLVTVSAGTNDAHRHVSLAAYSSDITAIVDRIETYGAESMLLTATPMGAHKTHVESIVKEYNAFLRQLAVDRGFRLAEIYGPMQIARDSGVPVLEADGVHISFDGYRVVTRAILDALGFADVPTPETARLEPMPGLVREWRMRRATAGAPATGLETARDGSGDWTTIRLPVTLDTGSWWSNQEAARGFAVKLDELIGTADAYQGVASVTSDSSRDVILNAGAGLKRAWLNGEEVYQGNGANGWHAGRDRVPAALRAGENRIVIETSTDFFLSLTEA